MTKFKRVLSIALCIILVCSLFAGCSSNNKNINFIYPFSANVKSYDPQIATTADEFMIIENTFEGLIRIDDDGTVKKGVADKWSISKDGLTYTFNLKKGLKWNIDTDKDDDGIFVDSRLEMMNKEFNPDITANDFVFALQRACLPITDSPYFDTISAIKNATKVHNGKADASSLGVTAKNKYTLVITLERPDDNFLYTLTTAIAMPCNEEFFNATKGRYGLSTKYTLFNGQFYLDQILESSYLLKKNEYYKGDFPAIATELTFKIPDEKETNAQMLEKIESGYYDGAFIRGDETEALMKKSNITYKPYEDTTWAFILNTNDEYMQSKSMRKAFCEGFTRISKTGKDYLSPAKTLTPSSCTLGTQNAAKAIGDTIIESNQEESINDWKKAITILDTTYLEINIITPNYMEEYAKKMLQGVQAGIGTSLKTNNGDTVSLTLKVTAMEESEFNTAIKTGNYSIALYPFETTSSSAIAFLSSVVEQNPTGFDTTNMKAALDKANKSNDADEIAKATRKAERSAMLSYSICPMLYETSYYVAAEGVKDIQFHAGTGRVSFVNATRENKK